MDRGEFRFLRDSDENKKNETVSKTSVDQVLSDNRRTDDALLNALSLVLSSNSEYARSVSALLENDLSRDQSVDQLKDVLNDVLNNTQRLIKSQEDLKSAIDKTNIEYRDLLKAIIKENIGSHQSYMDSKFKALFENAGLKEDGSNYGPTDKVFLKIKALLTSELFAVAIGALLYYFATLIIRAYK